LLSAFGAHIQKAIARSKAASVVTEHNVYQEGDDNILPSLDEMAETLMLPGSGVQGMEHHEDLLARAESGKSCLLLLEHYSNLDLSIFSLLVRKAGAGARTLPRPWCLSPG
jgi:glycerol-3-phosphate O-acyltransferase